MVEQTTLSGCKRWLGTAARERKVSLQWSIKQGKVNVHNDVVDWNVNQFDEETDESHDGKANCRCNGNLLELYDGKEALKLDIREHRHEVTYPCDRAWCIASPNGPSSCQTVSMAQCTK